SVEREREVEDVPRKMRLATSNGPGDEEDHPPRCLLETSDLSLQQDQNQMESGSPAEKQRWTRSRTRREGEELEESAHEALTQDGSSLVECLINEHDRN